MSTDSGYFTGGGYKDISPSFQYVSSPVAENSTSSSFFFEFDNEKSLNTSTYEKSEKSEELENIIEKIMEDNYMEKTEKVTEIKVKFETQINEFSGQGGIYVEIANQMRKKMKEEIAIVTQALDLKRKDEIAKAKSEHLKNFNS